MVGYDEGGLATNQEPICNGPGKETSAWAEIHFELTDQDLHESEVRAIAMTSATGCLRVEQIQVQTAGIDVQVASGCRDGGRRELSMGVQTCM